MSTAIGVNGTATKVPSLLMILTTKDKDAQIIVVGGGPVGTLTSLRLARAGIKVLLLEADAVPSSAPRAAVYTGPSVLELQRAGILDDVRALGLQQGDVCWRKVNGEIIAGLDRKKSDDPLNPVTLDQFRLETVILKHMEPYSNAKILWGHKVTALEQDKNGVTITAETLEGKTKKFTSEYVIGADGGRSTIRKLIDVKFEGFTWPWTISTFSLSFSNLKLLPTSIILSVKTVFGQLNSLSILSIGLYFAISTGPVFGGSRMERLVV